MPPISCTECKQHPLVTRITGSNAETCSALRVALVDEDGSFSCSLGQKVVCEWVASGANCAVVIGGRCGIPMSRRNSTGANAAC